MNAQQVDRDEEEYEESLREAYGDVIICGISCDAADALKVVDEIAFDTGYADWNAENRKWQCEKCDEKYDDEETAEACCEELDNEEFDECFRELHGIESGDDRDHNELNATLRTQYSYMIDAYEKNGDISKRQAENFTYNGFNDVLEEMKYCDVS